MTSNPRGSHPFRRSTSRKPFKPELDLLESRDLLSVASGLMPPDLIPGSPSGGLIGDRILPPILPPVHRAGLNLSAHFLEVTRGGPAVTYTASLTARPTANVTVTITQDSDPIHILLGDRLSDGSKPPPLDVSPTTLTFTPDNWDQPQTVTVSAPADDTAHGDRGAVLIHKLTSEDPAYRTRFALPVAVVIRDEPPAAPAGLVVSAVRLEVSHGASVTYTVALATPPTADVTVKVVQADPPWGRGLDALRPIGDDIELTISPATLTFTAENWNVPQTVTITVAEEDAEILTSMIWDGGPVRGFALVEHQVSSADPNYDGLESPPIRVLIHDAPPAPLPGVRVSDHHLELTPENGQTDTFTIVLTSQPTAPVTFTITQSHTFRPVPFWEGDGSTPRHVELTITPTTLTFTPENWDQPQTVTVSLPADVTLARPLAFPLLTFTVKSDDPDYDNLWVVPVGVSIVPPRPEPIEVRPPIVILPPPIPLPPLPPPTPVTPVKPNPRAAARKAAANANRLVAALRARLRRKKRRQS